MAYLLNNLCPITPVKTKGKSHNFNPNTVTGFDHLTENEKSFVYKTIDKYNLSFSNSRLFTEAAVDLKQWGVASAQSIVNRVNSLTLNDNRQFTKLFFSEFEKERKAAPHYTTRQNTPEKKFPGRVLPHQKDNKVFGPCPVASKKTVCCNLMTIDAATDCALGCNYCAIQTMFSNDNVEVDSNLAQKLKALKLDPNRHYHIGTGQSSDSLLSGNKFGILDALTEFCRDNPNVFLEFKSKSSNTAYFEKTHRENPTALPRNMFFSWSLNPQIFIDAEELHTAPLARRLKAAKTMVGLGFKVGFHLHPIVYFSGWETHYHHLCQQLLNEFDPKDIVYISLGSLTIPRSVYKKIRSGGFQTMVTKNLTAENPEKKLTYPAEIKELLFKTVYDYLQPLRKSVFFYLCMEEAKYWYSLFGTCYQNNDEFEQAMLKAIKEKIAG